MNKTWGVLIGLLGVFSLVKGQWADSLSNAKIAIGFSTNAYRGDLGQPYDKWTLAFQGSWLFNHQGRLHGGIHLSYGSLTGQARDERAFDSDENTPNRFFKTTFLTAHYALTYDIIHRENLVFYFSQGLGFVRFTPKNQFNQSLVDNLSTRAPNEMYGRVAAVLPTHVGVNYFFPNRFGVGTKVGFFNFLTDYLDNVSQLGSDSGNDNALQFQFLFFLPVAF